jgi:hypothetical protein
MAVDPIAFIESHLPELFARARQGLEAAAHAGDQTAQAGLAAVTAEPIRTRLIVAGKANDAAASEPAAREVMIVTDREALRVEQAHDVIAGFGYALQVARGAVMIAIGMVERGELEPEQVARAFLMMGSQRARQMLAAAPFAFDATVLNVPALGTTTVRVGLGRVDLPARSDFSLNVEYDELEDARERGMAPHQLFLAGKMRVDGDASQAMRLGMLLAQLVKP